MIKKVMFVMVGMLFSVNAWAATYTGTFDSDDNVVYVQLDLAEDSLIQFESFGYAGGTMSDGSVVADGGFDSVLHLFQPFGTEILVQDDGASRVSASSGSSYDFLAQMYLTAGQYFIAITQYANFWDGSAWSGAQTDGFVDVGGYTRTNQYAFEYTVLSSGGVSAVPVPAALFLFAPALLGFLGFRRKASQAA